MKFRENLRKAGQKIADIDEAYADKAAAFIGGDPEKRGKGPIGFARGIAGGVAGASHRHTGVDWEGHNPSNKEKRQARAAQIGIVGAGYGIRYGLPAAGVTLAGKGILDLTAAFTGMGDQQTGSQIEIDYNSPAHGSTLSPESHQTYIKLHKELMADIDRPNGSPEKIRAMYAAGQFDHDERLKAHIGDVMG